LPRSLVALLVARAAIEAVFFSGLVALFHAAAAPKEAIGLGQTAVLLFGCELIAIAILRETRPENGNLRDTHQPTALAVVVIGAAVIGGLLLPWRSSDLPVLLMRAIGFGIIGEVFLWRALSLARGSSRWSQVRSSGTLAVIVIAIAAFVPFVDQGALPFLALAALLATGVGLSLARSIEELDLARAEGRDTARGGSALGTAFALGVLAVVAAAFAPSLQSLLASTGDALAPFLAQALFYALLPLGYLAAYLVEFLRGVVGRFPRLPQPQPLSPADLERDEEIRRAMLETRPVVVIGFELLIAAIAIVVAIVLVERMRRERREELPPGASLERERTAGMGVRDMLAGLLPRRAPPRRRPADDGTPAGAVRLLYWRLLELAERAGIGWRADDETPAEHAERMYRAGEPWPAAAPVVRAFELVRYGELTPSTAQVDAARASIRTLEAPKRDSRGSEQAP